MVQENLYQELCSILGKDGNVTSGSLAKLSYLRACVKESARQVNLSSTNSILELDNNERKEKARRVRA